MQLKFLKIPLQNFIAAYFFVAQIEYFVVYFLSREDFLQQSGYCEVQQNKREISLSWCCLPIIFSTFYSNHF